MNEQRGVTPPRSFIVGAGAVVWGCGAAFCGPPADAPGTLPSRSPKAAPGATPYPLSPPPKKGGGGGGGGAPPRQVRQTCLERDNQEYQALHRNLLPHVATGIMTSINYMQKSRIDEKTQLVRILAALTPLVTRDKRGWVLSCIMAAYRPRQGRSRQDLAVRI